MWQVKDHTPFASQGYFLRDKDGVEHWVVALRGSFEVRDSGLCGLAQEQVPVRLVPDYLDADASVLREESDFQPFRPRADVALYGTATAPAGQAAPVIEVGLSVGPIRKTLHATGPRRITRRKLGYTETEPEPITTLPLSWAYGLGGESQIANQDDDTPSVHEANPVGKGWLHDWKAMARGDSIELPQIFDPKAPVVAKQPFPDPQGFGVLAPNWQPRLKYAGTFDDEWQEKRHPRLPVDHDDRFNQSVLDDQTAALVGGELVEVTGVRESGAWAFRLPQVIATARTRIGRDTHDTRFRLVGVTLDADANSVSMIWNTAIPCNGRDTEVEQSTLRIRQISGVEK